MKSPSYVTAWKLRSSITRDRNVEETRSQRQIAKRLPGKAFRNAFRNVRFIVQREINFRESEKSSFSSFRVLGQRRVRHFACQTQLTSIVKGFCDILREIDVVCVAKVIAAWKFFTSSAERIRIALELIVEEHCSRRYQKLHCFSSSFAFPTGW